MIPSEAARKLDQLVEGFATQAARCREHPGAGEVHDLRVSVRRLEQALGVFAKWVPAKAARRIRTRTEAILDAAGLVRDCDIAGELSKSLGFKLGAASSVLRRRRLSLTEQLGRLLDQLERTREKWCAALELDDAVPGAAKLERLARKALPREARRFIESGSGLVRHPKSRSALHRFRIAAKRFRYQLELFGDLYGAPLARRIAAVRKVQTLLGDWNDCVATRRLLKESGVSPASLDVFKQEEHLRLREFQTVWPKLFGKGSAAGWVRFLNTPGSIGSSGAVALQ